MSCTTNRMIVQNPVYCQKKYYYIIEGKRKFRMSKGHRFITFNSGVRELNFEQVHDNNIIIIISYKFKGKCQ